MRLYITQDLCILIYLDLPQLISDWLMTPGVKENIAQLSREALKEEYQVAYGGD